MDNRIKAYFHCKTCLNLDDMTDVSHMAVGWTPKGLQVWCETCDQNVVALDFKGNKVDVEDE